MPIDDIDMQQLRSSLVTAVKEQDLELFLRDWKTLSATSFESQRYFKSYLLNIALEVKNKDMILKMSEDAIIQHIFSSERYSKRDLLLFAAQHGSEDMLARLLKTKNIRGSDAAEALVVAVKNRYIGIVRMLINDYSLNTVDELYVGPMFMPETIMAILLQDYRLQAEHLGSALIEAADCGDIEMLEMLLDDLRIEEKSILAALRRAVVNGHKDASARLIKQVKLDANEVGKNLYFSTERGSLAIVCVLLAQNLAKERHLRFALNKAKELKNEPIINALQAALDLLAINADLNTDEQKSASRCRRFGCSIQ